MITRARSVLRLLEAEQLAQSRNIPDLELARDLLQDFESRFPNSGNASSLMSKNGPYPTTARSTIPRSTPTRSAISERSRGQGKSVWQAAA